jgi:hypothetical protein
MMGMLLPPGVVVLLLPGVVAAVLLLPGVVAAVLLLPGVVAVLLPLAMVVVLLPPGVAAVLLLPGVVAVLLLLGILLRLPCEVIVLCCCYYMLACSWDILVLLCYSLHEGPDILGVKPYDAHCVYANLIGLDESQVAYLEYQTDRHEPRIPFYVCRMLESNIDDKKGKMVKT